MTNNWISISDYLPDEYEYVLINVVDYYNTKLRYIPLVGYMKNGVWFTRDGYTLQDDYIPTHWMSLPKKPN